MFKKLSSWWRYRHEQKTEAIEEEDHAPLSTKGAYTTDVEHHRGKRQKLIDAIHQNVLKNPLDTMKPVDASTGIAMDGAAMDDLDNSSSLKRAFSLQGQAIPDALLGWYASQGFIGYQTMAMIAQNWLVDKACDMPAKDAVRNGYELTFNDGDEEINAEIIQDIKSLDKTYGINNSMREFVKMGRVFGIRVAIFKIDFDGDKEKEFDFYAKPFNIDAVTPGSYKGIAQVDPYWMSPELDQASISDPSSLYFYVPTWWRLPGGLRVHRSHIVTYINSEVADILKPSYLYGGVSVPQKMFERVYASERTANEAPQLALTKRSIVLKTDITEAMANQKKFENNLSNVNYFKDNYAVWAVDNSDQVEHFDTTLSDLDAVIMTQFQLDAAIADVPATKLLGTSPKGFNASGDYEEESYNQMLESVQENDLTPLLNRHYMLLMRSDIAPDRDIDAVPEINWNPLTVLSAKEIAEINNLKSQTAMNYQGAGAIDGGEIRDEVIADENSGFNGVTTEEDDDLDGVFSEVKGLSSEKQNAALGMDNRR